MRYDAVFLFVDARRPSSPCDTSRKKATGHDMGDWKVTKKAKPGVEGAKERSCKNCDYTETAVIPAEKPADEDGKSARTGDDTNIALYGLLAILAAAGACGTLYRRKKNS